jgi:hypothetical protein
MVEGMVEVEGMSDGMDDVEGERLIDGWEEGATLREGESEGIFEGWLEGNDEENALLLLLFFPFLLL